MSAKVVPLLLIAIALGHLPLSATIAAPSTPAPAETPKRVERWPALSESEEKSAIDALQAFADDAGKRVKVSFAKKETPFFLFYSDLPDDVAARSCELLDAAYLHLCELLGVPKDQNIWRGKAAVFVFSKAADYRRFEKSIHGFNPGRAAGVCHSLENGDVHIAFYQQDDEKEFAHVLVHETVHGFLHRLKTPAEVPSWIDEGFAEAIASEMSPQEGRGARTLDYAKKGVESNNGLGGMFDAEQIERWQYPVAQIMTEHLMHLDKEAFAHFISDIKRGDAWEAALKGRFHLTRDDLVRDFDAIEPSKESASDVKPKQER